MNLSTPMKEAIKQWELKNEQKISQAVEIKLNGILPPLDKMDASVLYFHHCEKLSLSSNCIERLANMSSLKRLRILSLGRNNIKSISGLEAVAETLEELWISYNQIEKLKGIGCMKKLRLLTMSNNNVREWLEFTRLADLTALKEVVFIGNPLEEKCSLEGTWRSEVARRLPNLNKLDGYQLTDCDLPIEEDPADDDAADVVLPKSQFGQENDEEEVEEEEEEMEEEEEEEENEMLPKADAEEEEAEADSQVHVEDVSLQ